MCNLLSFAFFLMSLKCIPMCLIDKELTVSSNNNLAQVIMNDD